MARITGSLRFVTDNPAQVSEVWVRAPQVRTHVEGVVTTGNDRFPVTGGEVSFTAVPGPAVLALISQGRAVDTIPILVGDGAEQTLRQVVEAAELADEWTLTELERLAQQIAKDVSDAGVLVRDLGGIDGIVQTRTALEEAAQTTTDNAQAVERAKTDTINARDKAEAASTTATEQADVATEQAGVATEQATAAQNNATKAAQSEAGAEEAKTEAERHADAASTSATNAANSLAQVTPTAQAAISDYIASGTSVQDAARTAVSDIAPDIVETLTRGELPWRGTLPDGTDMNTVRAKGFYTVPTTSAAATMVNWPTRRAGVLKVFTNDASAMTSQEVTAYVSTAEPVETYSRATLSTANTSWGPWATSEWAKGVLSATADNPVNLDTFRTAGAWAVTSTANVTGMPVPNTGVLENFSWPGTGLSMQRYLARVSASETREFRRTSLTTSGFGGVAWVESSGGASAPTTTGGVLALPDGTNLATWRKAGMWIIPGIINAKTMSGMPTVDGAQVYGPGLLEVIVTSESGRGFERLTVESGGTIRHFERTSGIVTSWPEWVEVTTAGSGEQAPAVPERSTAVADHAARVEYARSRRGGGIGTSGKAVVMLRFDHWLVAFRDNVLPILRKHQLPATLNMNYDNLGIVANGEGTITWEDVQDWNQRYGIEIANHGSTHTNPDTAAGIYHEVVEGRRNLESAMPRVAVETWQEHGSAYLTAADIDGDIGLNLGREPRNFFESYAGRLVLAEHAVVEGKTGGFFHPLSGSPQIGQSHYSADRSTSAQAIAQVDTAQALERGLTLYTHPGSMNNVLVGGKNHPYEEQADGSFVVTNPADGTTRKFDTEQDMRDWASKNGHIVFMSYRDFDVLCAHLAAERDAGRLMVMTAAGGAFADKSHDRRENLLVKADFTDGYSTWWSGTAGWTVANPGAEVTLTSTSSAGQLNQGMLLHSRFGWAMGAAHELVVRVSANTETTLTLRAEQMGNATNWNVGETFTVPGDGVARDYRINITLPRDPSITQIRWFIGGPSMTIHGAPLLAAI